MYNFTMNDTEENDTDNWGYHCNDLSGFYTLSGAVYILIFIFSITGNILLLCILVTFEKLKNVTNLFVLNLACSDLVFTVTLPLWAVYVLHHWVFGEFACKFVTAAYFIGLYSSVILLTAMTVDRFITVVLNNWPGNSVVRQKCAVGACAAAWIISIAASITDAVKVTVESTWDDTFSCDYPSDTETDVNLAYYLQVSLLFFLPFAIIVFCYSSILKTVLQASNRRRYRTVVVVFCIVAAFFICWGPYNILLFIKSLYEPADCYDWERMESAISICKLLAFSHCFMNPLLYLLSQKARKHLVQFIRCKICRKTSRERVTGPSTCISRNLSSTIQNSAIMMEPLTQ